MSIFKKKIKSGNSDQKQSENKSDSIEINERPRICCIDIQKNVEDELKARSFTGQAWIHQMPKSLKIKKDGIFA